MIFATQLRRRYCIGDRPASKRICEELGLPWANVQVLAFITGPGQAIALGLAPNERDGDWLTEDYCD